MEENLVELYATMFNIQGNINKLEIMQRSEKDYDRFQEAQDQIDILKVSHYDYAVRAHAEAIRRVHILNDLEDNLDDIKVGGSD